MRMVASIWGCLYLKILGFAVSCFSCDLHVKSLAQGGIVKMMHIATNSLGLTMKWAEQKKCRPKTGVPNDYGVPYSWSVSDCLLLLPRAVRIDDCFGTRALYRVEISR